MGKKKQPTEPRKDGGIKTFEKKEVRNRDIANLRAVKNKQKGRKFQSVYPPEEKLWVFAKKGKNLPKIVEQIKTRTYLNFD